MQQPNCDGQTFVRFIFLLRELFGKLLAWECNSPSVKKSEFFLNAIKGEGLCMGSHEYCSVFRISGKLESNAKFVAEQPC